MDPDAEMFGGNQAQAGLAANSNGAGLAAAANSSSAQAAVDPEIARRLANREAELFRQQQRVANEYVASMQRQAREAEAEAARARNGNGNGNGSGTAAASAQPRERMPQPDLAAPLQDAAVFGAVCAVTSTSPTGVTYPLATQIGLPAQFCEAWSDMAPPALDACAHTFQHANTNLLQVSQAQLCGAAIGDALGLSQAEFLDCVRDTSSVPSARCSIALRPALILGDNAPAQEQVRRGQVQRSARRLSTADEQGDILKIREIAQKPQPTPDDVHMLTALCRWNRGSANTIAANEILARDFLSLPHMTADGLDRIICTEANDNCSHYRTVAEICHGIQNKYASNAMRLKVEEAGGRANLMPGQRLAAAQLIYPEPYGSTFLDIAAACNSDRMQGEVAQTLQSDRRRDVSGHANICQRVERTTSVLPPMNEAYTQLSSIV